MSKIISWNVAGLRARLPLVLKLLSEEQPDILMLQETKMTQDIVPVDVFKQVGYTVSYAGQKGFNGVAILSRLPVTITHTHIPNLTEETPQARYIEVMTQTGIYLSSIYLPNGNPSEKDPFDTSKLTYKLLWMKALYRHIQHHLSLNHSVIFGGDFNVIAQDSDVYNPAAFQNNALMLPQVRQLFQDISRPLNNTLRSVNQTPHLYSFWDYQRGAWPKNNGMLLDVILTTPDMSDYLTGAGILKEWRGLDRPSDHTPIWCSLSCHL